MQGKCLQFFTSAALENITELWREYGRGTIELTHNVKERSKKCHLCASKNEHEQNKYLMVATIIAEFLLESVIVRNEVPLELQNVQGRNFKSELWRKLMELLGIKKTRTTIIPNQNYNRTIITIYHFLSHKIRNFGKSWCLFLLSYRRSRHRVTSLPHYC